MPDPGRVRLTELARLFGWTAVLIPMTILVVGGTISSERSWSNLQTTSQRANDSADAARYACLEAELRRRLPAHSTVIDAGSDTLDFQRIAEELTPGYRFTTVGRAGDYRVRFVTPGPCNGFGVQIAQVT